MKLNRDVIRTVKVLDEIGRNPGNGLKEMAQRLEMDERDLYQIVYTLVKENVLTEEDKGYFLSEDIDWRS